MEQKEGEKLNPIISQIIAWYDFWVKHYQNEEAARGKKSGVDIPFVSLKQALLYKDESGWRQPNDLSVYEYDKLAKALYDKNPVALTDWNRTSENVFSPDERDDKLRESVSKLLEKLPQTAEMPV